MFVLLSIAYVYVDKFESTFPATQNTGPPRAIYCSSNVAEIGAWIRGGGEALKDTSMSHPDVPICRASFVEYYSLQGILATEGQPLLDALMLPLPISFRKNVHPAFARSAQDSVKRLLECPCTSIVSPFPGTYVTPKCDRSNLPEFVRRELKRGTTSGTLSRQEIVSMVPVLLLDPIVKGQSKCLDMCAAPGSKTTQLLERCPALVVANDFSLHRAGILSRRCRGRVPAEIAARLVVVNHRAQAIPRVASFDRIVCDVPCTGDGAIRKNQDLWRYWQPHLGIELHSRQLQIAMRAASLLAVGGSMAYSTCSLNPIENEAVVSALLRQSDGALELVDVRERLPELLRRPGLKSWAVADDALTPFESYSASQELLPRCARRRIRKSMFPPQEEWIKEVLPRCVRMYPHLQDTGGFFVAILRKKAPLLKGVEEARISRKRKRSSSQLGHPPRFYPVPQGIGIDAARGAGLDAFNFWNAIGPYLFSRSPSFRRIFFLSDSARDVCTSLSSRLNAVRAGVLVLQRGRDGFELCQEGLDIVVDFLRPERIIHMNSQRARSFLSGHYRPIMNDLEIGTYVVKGAFGRTVVACVAYEHAKGAGDDDDGEGSSDAGIKIATNTGVSGSNDKVSRPLVTREELVLQACTTPEVLAMSSKQLMDFIYQKFKVRTKELREILDCKSVGEFLIKQREKGQASTMEASTMDKPSLTFDREPLSGESIVSRKESPRLVRVLRPSASWCDRQNAEAKAF